MRVIARVGNLTFDFNLEQFPRSRPTPALELRPLNLLTCRRFNGLQPHSNAIKKVIDTQCTSMLSFPVFATRKSRPALPAPLPFPLSSHSSLFFSEVCSLFFVTAVSQPFVYQSLRHSFHRDGGSHPSSQKLCAIFAPCYSPLPVPKSRRPLPLRAPKPRRINTYEKHGGGGYYC